MKKRKKSKPNFLGVISNVVNGKRLLSVAGILLSAVAEGYGGQRATTPEDAERGRAIVREMLAAARAGGFPEGGNAESVLTKNFPSQQALTIAQAACAHITPEALIATFRRAGFSIDDDFQPIEVTL